jgi:hypothetical protein
MDFNEALTEENRRLKRLRFVVDLTLARLYQDPDLSMLEALEQVERCREAALRLFPGKAPTFELIIRPRLERALHGRWPHDMPKELGEKLTVREPESS